MNDDFSLYFSDYQKLEKEFRMILKGKLDAGKINVEYIQVNFKFFILVRRNENFK